jgi:hypothetical protein
MASGSIRAQLKNFLPGKSHTAVSHAAPTPIMDVPAITPTHRIKVFFSKSIKRVSTICCQISDSGCRKNDRITKIGKSTHIAENTAINLKLTIARAFFSNVLYKGS